MAERVVDPDRARVAAALEPAHEVRRSCVCPPLPAPERRARRTRRRASAVVGRARHERRGPVRSSSAQAAYGVTGSSGARCAATSCVRQPPRRSGCAARRCAAGLPASRRLSRLIAAPGAAAAPTAARAGAFRGPPRPLEAGRSRARWTVTGRAASAAGRARRRPARGARRRRAPRRARARRSAAPASGSRRRATSRSAAAITVALLLPRRPAARGGQRAPAQAVQQRAVAGEQVERAAGAARVVPLDDEAVLAVLDVLLVAGDGRSRRTSRPCGSPPAAGPNMPSTRESLSTTSESA